MKAKETHTMPKKGSGLEREARIIPLCNGVRSSREIADILGESAKYVQATMKKRDLPRMRRGAHNGEMNHQYKSGRRIDLDGYVLVAAPKGHPMARQRKDRNSGIILEHRLVMERKLGRFLGPKEVVDHIDGLHLHNDPSNLRLFASNADHLKATITGRVPQWSQKGRRKQLLTRDERLGSKPVDTYHLRKRNGDVRLLQILLALLKLGEDSPFLLGTHHHLVKAGIDPSSRSNLERALGDLYQKYA